MAKRGFSVAARVLRAHRAAVQPSLARAAPFSGPGREVATSGCLVPTCVTDGRGLTSRSGSRARLSSTDHAHVAASALPSHTPPASRVKHVDRRGEAFTLHIPPLRPPPTSDAAPSRPVDAKASTPAQCTTTGDPSRPKVCYVLHGLLGSHRGWVALCRRWARDFPQWRFVLVDLRNHGSSYGFSQPHTVEACVDDVARLFDEHGHPDAIVGHSFGGKQVMLLAQEWVAGRLRHPASEARRAAAAAAPAAPAPEAGDGAASSSQDSEPDVACWVLDTLPGSFQLLDDAAADTDSVVRVLEFIRSIRPPIPSRDWLQKRILSEGFSRHAADWILTNVSRYNAGQHGHSSHVRVPHPGEDEAPQVMNGDLVWSFDAPSAAELLSDYAGLDLWPVLEQMPPLRAHSTRVRVEYVAAQNSARWRNPLNRARLEALANKEGGENGGAVARAGSRSDGGGGDPAVRVHMLERAGHWVHVDNPAGLQQLLSHTFAAAGDGSDA